MLLCATFGARAAEFTQTVCRDGAQIGLTQTPSGQAWNPAPVIVYEQFFGMPVTGALRDVYIVGALKINDRLRKAYTDNWQLEIEYTIKFYDNNDNAIQTLSGEKLAVNFFKNGTYEDYAEKIYRSATNYRKAHVTITQINALVLDAAGAVTSNYTIPTLGGTLFEDVSLEWRCTSVRNFEMSATAAPTVNHVSGTQINPSPVCAGNTPDNIIRLGWTYLPGAESYDVEWLFLDVPPTWDDNTNSYVLPTLSQLIDIDWRRATRVNVTGNFYDIPLLYPTGIMIYRVRGVGVDVNNNFVRMEGKWSRNPPFDSYIDDLAHITDAFVYCGLESGLNWTSSLTFAEEGKSKGVVSFADGTGRTRQTVTTLSTDENTVVAEPSLDNMGRASVQFLPVPVRGEQFKYFPAFNDGYEAPVFDTYGTFPNATPVPATVAANEFYSGGNPFLALSGTPYDDYLARIGSYIPDAGNYPFTQTRVMNDGSGRPQATSGVGGKHMLGGGHDTRYFYGTPGGQAELDRLFGSEAGFVAYYTKNMAVDPNGQTSVSYVDGYGRTVATALAGNNTNKQLQSINDDPPVPLVADLLGSNTLQGNGTLTATKDFLVPAGGAYDFSYSVSPGEFESLCSGTYGCKLEFLITVKTDEGVEMIAPAPAWYDVSTTTFPYTFSVSLQPGKYTVTKTLRVKQTEFVQVMDAVSTNLGSDWNTTANACFVPPFVGGCLACETQCENAYRYDYTFNGNTYRIYRKLDAPGLDYTTDPAPAALTDADGNPMFTLITAGDPRVTGAEAAITACKTECDNIPTVNTNSECEMKRILLIRDLLPGGQYFDNRPKDPSVSGTANPDYITGADNDPDNRNAWLEAYAADLKDDFGVLLNPANTGASWTQIRNGWATIDQYSPAFQTLKDQLVTRHPEYCLWKAFCQSGNDTCNCNENQQPHYGTPNNYANVMANTHTDPGAVSGQLFMPTDQLPIITGAGGTTFSIDAYVPKTIDGCMGDPLFYCHPELKGGVDNRLVKYMSVTANTGPVDISIWYLMDDPENLRSHDLTLGSHPLYPNDFVAYIQVLHGSPADSTGGILNPANANAVGKWQFFRNVYGFIRMQLQYNMAAAEALTCMDCDNTGTHPLCDDVDNCGPGVACQKLPFFSAWDNDDDGFMDLGTGNNAFSFQGMQLRYPYINLMANAPNTAAGLGADYCETNCSALATQWISQLETGIRGCVTIDADADGNLITPTFTIPEPDRLMLRDYFTNICQKSCSTQTATGTYTHDYTVYPPMTAGDWAGAEYVMGPYVSGTTVITDINEVVSRYVAYNGNIAVCPVIINAIPPAPGQPSPDPNLLACACGNLADLLSQNGGLKAGYEYVNPTKGAPFGYDIFEFATIRQLLVTHESATPAFIAQIQALGNADFETLLLHWLNACNENKLAEIPPVGLGGDVIAFPAFLVCEPDTLPGEMDCAQVDAEQEQNVNAAAFALFKQTQLDLFETGYRTSCLEQAQPVETFTMSYELSEYHYTLYYYDQAGNLVKTVPPEGVELITDPTTLADIAAFRLANHHLPNYAALPGFKWPAHTKISNYVYNGQNQVVEQTTPDGGTSTFYYDALGRLVASQNAQQATGKTHSYTLFDTRGRTIEVGEIKTLPFFVNGDRKKTQRYVERFPTAIGAPTPFEDQLANNEADKTQITKTFYDDAVLSQWGIPATAFAQRNLRNRVATTVYYAVFPQNGWAYYDNAVHYTYDVHGNVNRLAQDIPALQTTKRRFLYTDYVYDLVSGNVNEVHYMKGHAEQFSHYYCYDADNRLTLARTSKNGGLVKELEAKYFYYPTGPLLRTELGRAQVQGMDYAYTSHGWLKGVNTDEINTLADMGRDAWNKPGLHAFFGVDAASFTLGYYHGDYTPVGSPDPFEADLAQADDMATAMHPATSALADWGLYNGNIAKMVAAGLDCDQNPMEVLGRSFMYDQLNRLISSTSFVRANQVDFQSNLSPFSWNGISPAAKWDTHYGYDADGNIQNLTRLDDAGNLMDDLTYAYIGSGNRLGYVEDLVVGSPQTNDIENHASTSNYGYDAIGNLTQDLSEDIRSIRWSVYGKIKSIERTPGSTRPNLWFGYNPVGQRIVKVNGMSDIANVQRGYAATFYALDAQGNAMAIYELKEEDDESGKYQLICADQMIYGSSRIGMYHRNQKICTACDIDPTALENSASTSAAPQDYAAPVPMGGTVTPKAVLGTREYEFVNHLDNVLATVADRKVFDETNDVMGSGTEAQVFQYRPEVLTAGDYYPFGSPLPGRGCSKPMDCKVTSYIVEEWVVDNPFINDVTAVLGAVLNVTSTHVEVNTSAPGEGAEYLFTMDEGAHQIHFDIDIMAMAGDAKPGLQILGYDPVTGDHTDLVAEIDEVQDITETVDFYSSGTRTYKMVLKQKNVGTLTFNWKTFRVKRAREVFTRTCNMTPCSSCPNGYRYGFNGQEKDDEVAGEGNSYTAEYWQYDPRLGKRWNIDPITFPWQSSYAAFNNNPIFFLDPTGQKGQGNGDGPVKKGDKVDLGNGQSYIASSDEVNVLASEPEDKSGDIYSYYKDITGYFMDATKYVKGASKISYLTAAIKVYAIIQKARIEKRINSMERERSVFENINTEEVSYRAVMRKNGLYDENKDYHDNVIAFWESKNSKHWIVAERAFVNTSNQVAERVWQISNQISNLNEEIVKYEILEEITSQFSGFRDAHNEASDATELLSNPTQENIENYIKGKIKQYVEDKLKKSVLPQDDEE